MRAVSLTEHGGPEVLRVTDVPAPERRLGDALVAVKACGLNHLDIWVRLGGKRPFPLPLVPGSDAAGVVVEAPEGSGLAAGDEVVIFPCEGCGACVACERGDVPLCADFKIYGASRDGALAELIAVPAKHCVPKPASMSFIAAASVAINYITAWHMLVDRARVRPGETVLIQAAGSGVSTAAIQIATAIGARVMATSSTRAKLEHARGLGAEEVVNYRDDDVAERARAWTGGRGVAVVVDHVGLPNWKTDIASLEKGGRFVFCGTTGGAEVPLNLSATYFQAYSILGSTMGRLDEFRTVLALIGQGRFAPVVDRVFPLDEIVAAHRYLESGEQTGKVVIEIGDE